MKIALIGKSGSGKDTVSNILVSNYGFKKINFSDDIYKIAREIFQMKDKDRNLLQKIGDKLREIDEFVFIKSVLKKCENIENVLVGDCRLITEYNALKEKGFVFLYIKAEESERIKRLHKRDGSSQKEFLEHKTETQVDEILREGKHITIENYGNIEDLADKIKMILNEKMN